MTKNILLLAAAALLAASLFAGLSQQAAHGKPEYNAAMSKANADRKAALAECRKLANDDQAACTARAKAFYDKTSAEAKAMYRKMFAQASI
jgi:predicted carbohydrate-binding protein with CBM5 and CBM33 domain